MAIFRCAVSPVSRSKGQSACASAAYRSGTKIYDAHYSKQHDYSKKTGVDFSRIIGFSGTREELWNEAELCDTRKNACVAREYLVAIPRELSDPEKIQFAEEYSQFIHDKHGCAVDLNIHDIDSDNPHVHILTTTRKVKDKKLDVKCDRELSDRDRKKKKLPTRKQDLLDDRKVCAEISNKYLKKYGIEVSHESNEVRGLKTKPLVKLSVNEHQYNLKNDNKTIRWEYNEKIKKENVLILEDEKKKIEAKKDFIKLRYMSFDQKSEAIEAKQKLEEIIKTDEPKLKKDIDYDIRLEPKREKIQLTLRARVGLYTYDLKKTFQKLKEFLKPESFNKKKIEIKPIEEPIAQEQQIKKKISSEEQAMAIAASFMEDYRNQSEKSKTQEIEKSEALELEESKTQTQHETQKVEREPEKKSIQEAPKRKRRR